MGFKLTNKGMNAIMEQWRKEYRIFAPRCYEGGNTFSDLDCIRYGEVEQVSDIVFDRKSDYSYKEVLLPLCETLLYFTEDEVKAADTQEKGAVIFLRSCDLHSVKRLDEIYLRHGQEDFYYSRLREKVKFVLIGCEKSFDNCFCVSMGTNQSDDYDAAIEYADGVYQADCKLAEWEDLFGQQSSGANDFQPSYVKENNVKVHIPENLSAEVGKSKMWEEYDSRCIGCGRCNFVCPTCTCFTMQDFYYKDNGRVGERRRVQASCMVDGYTDVAGGGCYRQKYGERMRFKVLHKVYDYKEKFGYHMCVGCGRCDHICPEYISFSNSINKLEKAMEEVAGNDK